MPKDAFIGVGNSARKVVQPYIGVNGVARKVVAAYVGVNGIARQWWPPVTNVIVPNLVGGACTGTGGAAQALIAAGLTSGGSTSVYHDTVPAGSVISQSHAAGSSVPAGTSVSWQCSLGPEPLWNAYVLLQTLTPQFNANVRFAFATPVGSSFDTNNWVLELRGEVAGGGEAAQTYSLIRTVSGTTAYYSTTVSFSWNPMSTDSNLNLSFWRPAPVGSPVITVNWYMIYNNGTGQVTVNGQVIPPQRGQQGVNSGGPTSWTDMASWPIWVP